MTVSIYNKEPKPEDTIIQKHQLTLDDIVKGGYAKLASIYYDNATYAAPLEKYNERKSLVVGEYYLIPSEASLLSENV